MNDNSYFFLIFLLCSFILIAGFSLTYYVNNNSYKKFLDSFSPMEKYANLTYYEKAQAQAEKNITYNPTLIIIFGISCICILFLAIIINIYRKPDKQDLNIRIITDINATSGGEITRGENR